MSRPDDPAMSRRDFLAAGASSAAVFTWPPLAAGAAARERSTTTDPSTPSMAKVTLTVNDEHHALTLDTRTSLLDMLREHLRLTGTKKGCDHGQCGACTAIVDGRRVNTCLTLAVMHEGSTITTIEGLGTPERLHPMQAAFVRHDGYQCGYCTPGQICSAVAVLDEIRTGSPSHVTVDLLAKPSLSADELRERLSGNICRCGAYSNIIEAVLEVGAA